MTTRIRSLLTIIGMSAALWGHAQTVNPTATYKDSEGEEQEMAAGDSYSGSAPIEVTFKANGDPNGYTSYYEWRFYDEDDLENPYLVRYEEETTYTFTTAGSHRVRLYAKFTSGDDVVEFSTEDLEPFSIGVSESKLEMPNAFSPNGDGINDIYKAKSGYQSIVQFDAYIYNRWGTKLYEWHDPSGGWDGTHNGKPVAQGVYFCLVKAKGADGREFNYKKDVNLLRGYTETSGASSEQ